MGRRAPDMSGIRRVPLQNPETKREPLRRSRRFSDRNGFQKRLATGLRLWRRQLDSTALEHDHPVTQAERKVKKLLNEHNRHLTFIAQRLDHAPDLLDDIGLNTFRGLVQKQQLGLGNQRPRNRQLLLLPAREIPPRRSAISRSTGKSS